MVVPVILSGGSGTRLWPLSTTDEPKQFISITDSEPLIKKTISRAQGGIFSKPVIIGAHKHRFNIATQIEPYEADIILEPVARNTAAAIISSALHVQNTHNPNELMLVMPSDHIIENYQDFCDIVSFATTQAANNIVTFGISPTTPHAGYGYIIPKHDDRPISHINNFIEKPNKSIAQSLINAGAMWNSGIFFSSAAVILQEAKKLCPELYFHCLAAYSQATIDSDFIRLEETSFSQCQDISFDNAIMEKTTNASVAKSNIEWSDIGSWKSVWENSKKDQQGNAEYGKIMLENCNNNLVMSDNKLTILDGIEDLCVINANNITYIARKENTDNIKQLMSKIEQRL